MKKLCKLSLILLFIMGLFMSGQDVKASEIDATLPVPKNLRTNINDWGFGVLSFDVANVERDGKIQYEVQFDDDNEFEMGYHFDFFESKKGTIWIEPGVEYSIRVRTVVVNDDGEVIAEGAWSEVLREVITYAAVQLKSVSTAGLNELTLQWKSMGANTDCDGYKIYRSTSEDGPFKLVKTIKDPYKTKWTNTGLKPGVTYYYRMRAYSDYYDILGKKSSTLSGVPKPVKKVLTVKCASTSSVKLSWKASGEKITGYQIYRATSPDGEFKRIKTITDRTKTSFINKNLTFGNTYYYKMRAYAVVDGEKYYSDFSTVKKVKVTIGVPEITSIKLAGITKATVNYTKVPNVTGYMVYRATKKDGEYKRIATIRSNKTLSYTATGMINGKTYYFKLRSYKKTDTKTYYSDYTEPVKRLMNKVGYKNETYEQKARRIFGKNYYVEYKTSAAASKDMKTIQIKTWDINSKGKKYTRYHYLTVHKNIAGTVQQIFKTIYNGKEKFPIKDVGGYSWRGNNSGSLHCEGVAIDINYNENAQFNGATGKPMTGELYKPGKNPYSIPPNGDVVKAFEKYGFIWGDWFSNPDYMHFSYFGG